MIKLIQCILVALLTIFIATSSSAQGVTIQLQEQESEIPIPFATIQHGNSNGTITNEEGFFSLSEKTLMLKPEITISSIGFEALTLAYEEYAFAEGPLQLKPAVNTLSTVYINNKQLTADTIISRAKRNRVDNYMYSNRKQRVFKRFRNEVSNDGLDLKITKNTTISRAEWKELNKNLKNSNVQMISNYSETLADYYTNDESKTKVDVIKATTLSDGRDGDANAKALAIISKSLADTTKTYKVKTGLFKIEDSLSLKNVVAIDEKDTNRFKTERERRSIDYTVDDHHFFSEFSRLDFLNTPEWYDYELLEQWDTEDDRIYKIAFTPNKGKAKFVGTVLVNDSDFAVLKVDYGYAQGKRGRNINFKLLFGVKFTETGWEGTLITRKNAEDFYETVYIKRQQIKEVYVNRPLKLIENTTKEKIKFRLKTTQIFSNTIELFFVSNDAISEEEYAKIIEAEFTTLEPLLTYSNDTWKDYNILEPLQAMKSFKN